MTTPTRRPTHPEITIRVQYHPDCRDGGVHVWERYPLSARGLGRAIDAHRRVCREAVQALGNIGCRAVWVDVAGTRLSTATVDELETARHAEYRRDLRTSGIRTATRTADLQQLLADCESGEYARREARIEAAVAAEMGV